MIATTPVFKALDDGRYVCFEPRTCSYSVVPRENVPPLVPLRLSEAGNKAKFGCAMLPLSGPVGDKIIALGKSIPDADLGEDGREDTPHITIRYGLHTDDIGEVLKHMSGFGPVHLKLGKVSIFAGAEKDKPYDVIKVDVESPQLVEMHDSLGDFPHTDTHSEYHPHATIAYVKAGLGEKYAQQMGSLNVEGDIGEAIYSNTEKQKGTIRLGGKGSPQNHKHQLGVLVAMAKFQQLAHKTGDPTTSKPYLDKLKALLKNPALRMSWLAATTKSGGAKAIGQLEHQGKTLYGDEARAALRHQNAPPTPKDSPGAPSVPTPEERAAKLAALLEEQKARDAASEFLERMQARKHTTQDMFGFADQLPKLPPESLDKATAIVEQEFEKAGGKPEEPQALMDQVRETLDAEDADKAPEHPLDRLAANHGSPEAIAAGAGDIGLHEAINAAHRGEHGGDIKAAVERGSEWRHHGGNLEKKHAAIGRELAALKDKSPLHGEEAFPASKGGEEIPSMPGLSPADRAVEEKARHHVLTHYPALKEQYLKDNGTFDQDGNLRSIVVNTDEWRHLFEPDGYNGTNAAAVHEPASYANKKLTTEMLKEQAGKEQHAHATRKGHQPEDDLPEHPGAGEGGTRAAAGQGDRGAVGGQAAAEEVVPPEAKPKEPKFTGTTTDSLGRTYHWVDGVRVPGPEEPKKPGQEANPEVEVPHGSRNRDQLAGPGREGESGRVQPGLVGGDAAAVPGAGEPGAGEGAGQGLPGLPDRVHAPGEGAVPPADGSGNAAPDGKRTRAPRTPRKRRAAGGPPRDDDGRRLGGGLEGKEPALPDPTPAEQVVSEPPTPENPTDLSAGNFRYSDREFFAIGAKAKFNANMAAIRTLREIQADGRTTATPEEQAILSKFAGWGQFPGVFNDFRDAGFEGQDAEDWQAQLEAQGMDYRAWAEERGKWAKERDALHALLSPDEWKAAKHSTLNAHYTHPDIVDAHWKMAQKLGFKGGKYLETSAGIGYYLGLMPPELAGKTRTSAVELDPTPGAMLALLYPNADVQVKGFEKHLVPPGFYDLIASNVPFGKYKPFDPDYNKHQAAIHDYFFLKSADKVRPGGLVMHITSTGTLDKPNSKIREELAKTCDLVGAVRFPGGAHKANAGTDVVTDMVILRKRLPGEEPGDDSWLKTTTVPDPAGGEAIPVNQYFADHPEQILGTLDRTGTMYRGESVNVSRTPDYEQRLQAAIDRLPANVMSSGRSPAKRFEPETLPAPGEVKIGGYHIQDGKLFVREGDGIVEQQVKPAERVKIEAHLGVRDAMRAVINAETAGEDAEPARAELNKVYDAFVKKHGPLNDPKNKKVFGDDPDAPPVWALEKYDRATKTATKADIFSKIVVGAIPPVTHANNVAEGLGVSLHESGGLDIDRIAELTGQHRDAVGKQLVDQGLAFEDPADGWQPSDHYLSGNVRRKLALARAAAANDPKYLPNVAALEKNQPEDIYHEDIDARLGSPWVPADDINGFIQKTLGAEASGIVVRYSPHNAEWTAEYATNRAGWDAKQSKAAREIWATSRADFMTIINSAMNGKMPNFQTRVPGSEPPQYTADKEANEAAAAKIQDIKDEFKNWVWTDDERRERLHRHYNDNFNNIKLLKYNGQHQNLPGMNPTFREGMHPHIKDFIWQVVTTGKGLAGHEVGTGKTTAMVASAMELRRLGLARKPALLCKKSNVDQITKEALELYPGAKILSTADMFTAEKRKLAASRIATGDYDMVIMTHDHMDALPMRPETMVKYIQEELAEVEAAYEAAYAANPDKSDRIVKNLEDKKADVGARLEAALNEKAKDDAVYFEDLGIDQMFVDEAHRYKSLPVYTKMSQLKGVPSSRSQRATSMLMRTKWLAEKNKGRGTVFLTGTPISNTMPELYTMQKFIQPEELKERGLDVFDAWANTFADVQTNLERKANGEYKPTTRLAEFTNMPELMQISRQMMDVVRADDLLRETKGGAAEEVPEEAKPKLEKYTGSTYDKSDNKYAWKDGKLMEYIVKRPKKNKVLNTSPRSDGIVKMMDDLKQRANDIKGQNPGKGEDNYLSITTDGGKGSIDLRLLYPDAPDDPDSKVNQLVGNVAKIHSENPGKTQMIFSDTRQSKDNPGFNVFDDIIEKLVKSGVSREKIVDFSDVTEKQREAAIAGLRDGSISVALGGTEKLGTGVNAQTHLLALHHLDCPHRPADLEQREGRAYRHGNKNKKIQIHNYVTEGSFDQMRWQGIDRKAKFIRAVMDTDPKDMKRRYKEEDTEELSYEQIMAAASGDPRILERAQLHEDIRKLDNAATRHEREQWGFKNTLKQADTRQKDIEGSIADYRATAAHLAGRPDFHLDVGGNEFKERGQAFPRFLAAQGLDQKKFEKLEPEKQKVITDQYAGESYMWDPHAALEKGFREGRGQVATYRGLPIHNESGWTQLGTLGGRRISSTAGLRAIENRANRITEDAEDAARALSQHHKDMAAIREKAGKEFPKVADLAKKKARLKELETAMAAKEVPERRGR